MKGKKNLQSSGSRMRIASPMQEFRSLDEARRFAQDAADTALIELAHSFRIESADGKVNEH
jgi:hypothetical protein